MQIGANPLKAAPLVLTLAVDERAQVDFEQQRRRYFPATLNRIPAHISLFHALPGHELPSIRQRLLELAATTTAFPVQVHDLQKLGRGVAYSLQSDLLSALHAQLRKAWLPWLTAQDAQGFRPHVVIQNKVDPAAAQALYARLTASFRPYSITAAGLLLWRYLGGPWELQETFFFPAGGGDPVGVNGCSRAPARLRLPNMHRAHPTRSSRG